MTALQELHASGRKWRVYFREGMWVAQMFARTPAGVVIVDLESAPQLTYAAAVEDLASQFALAEAAREMEVCEARLYAVIASAADIACKEMAK